MNFRKTLVSLMAATLVASACADPMGPAMSGAKIGTAALHDDLIIIGNCYFQLHTDVSVMTPESDCTTDQSILVPQGYVLQGYNHEITAVDPPGGHFRGAIIRNAPGATYVEIQNVRIRAQALADVCDAGDDRLRGVLLDGSAGVIYGVYATDIRQGLNSGCQEGNAIEVRNMPFDDTGSDLNVIIRNNQVGFYQKNGITVNGSVAADIRGNTVIGLGPIDHIAQNGIQIGFGATAILENNDVSWNYYTPKDTEACGLLFFMADGVRLVKNTNIVSDNETKVCNAGKGGGKFKPTP
jgi:hypothetical protein